MSTNTAAFEFQRTNPATEDGEVWASRMTFGQAITVGNYPDGVLWLNGQMMHVCAFEVKEFENGSAGTELRAVNPEFESDLESIVQLVGGCPEPVSLPGLTGRWIIYCLPKGA